MIAMLSEYKTENIVKLDTASASVVNCLKKTDIVEGESGASLKELANAKWPHAAKIQPTIWVSAHAQQHNEMVTISV